LSECDVCCKDQYCAGFANTTAAPPPSPSCFALHSYAKDTSNFTYDNAATFKRSRVQSQAVELRTLQFLFISSPVIKFPQRGLSSVAILSYQITTQPDRESSVWKALGMYYLQTTTTIHKS
jgi:hypothetical protein